MKDTRTAWAKESDAKWEAVREMKRLKDELEELKASLPKLKADVIREAMENINPMLPVDDYTEMLREYADEVERGEA